MTPTNESIGRLRELLVIRKKLESRNLPDSPWQQRHMQESMAYMPECAAFLYEHGETILAALEARELDRQAPGDDGDWYTSDHGSHVIDFDQDPANQLSILLKGDGTVSAVATRNGSDTCGGYGLAEVADVIRSWAAPQPPAQEQGEVSEVAAMDALVAAFNTWPADIRKKLSLHDLRRMTGWAPITRAAGAEDARDSQRLDYIERTFSGMTNRERYLPVQMIWGKGCNGRTLREACDKYMNREAAIASQAQGGSNG